MLHKLEFIFIFALAIKEYEIGCNYDTMTSDEVMPVGSLIGASV